MCPRSLLLLLLLAAAAAAPTPYVDRCPTPGAGRDDPPAVRLAWLRCAVRLGVDECDGTVPIAPQSDARRPCGGRDVTNGALGKLLVSGGNDTAGCMRALRSSGGAGATFTGQSWPAIWYEFGDRFNATDRAWIRAAIARGAAAYHGNSSGTWVRAGSGDAGVDVSYNNMYYMGMVNGILFGEIAGDGDATRHGYRLLENWLAYAQAADLHEFSSPTYYWVQINALYMGHLYARRPGARRIFSALLDHTWADVCANYFAPAQVISGPHSRDYDFLFGHGALGTHLYAQGLPGMTHMVCEDADSHCERADNAQNVFALLNMMHAAGDGDGDGDGYVVPAAIFNLTRAPVREVSGRFVGQRVDANGMQAAFAHRYNYVARGQYSIGSASQDYITNTHSKYYPCPQSKLLDIELGPERPVNMSRPLPAIVLVPDYLDAPYGHLHEPTTDKASHLAFHPGMVQRRNVLLATTAINTLDTLDGFQLDSNASAPRGDRWNGVSTSLTLPAAAGTVWIQPSQEPLLQPEPFTVPTVPFARRVNVGDTVGLAVGRGAVAIRVFVLDASAQQRRRRARGGAWPPSLPSSPPSPPLLQLKGDVEGLALGAIRLVGYHFNSSNVSSDRHAYVPYRPSKADTSLRWAALIKATGVPAGADAATRGRVVRGLVSEVAAAEISSTVGVDADGSAVWTASARIAAADSAADALELSVQRNLTCASAGGLRNQTVHTSWNCLVSRRVDGADVAVPRRLTINGAPAPPIPAGLP